MLNHAYVHSGFLSKPEPVTQPITGIQAGARTYADIAGEARSPR